MAANVRLKNANMTFKDGYFMSFDNTLNVLFEVTADGTTAFSYPLDTALSSSVKSLEYDGVNFWTLEDGTTVDQDLKIRRWLIDNYTCKLQQTISLIGNSSHKYKSKAMTVEHYHTTVTGTSVSGSYTLGIATGYESKLTSGVTVTLGPNINGEYETKTVMGAVSGTLTLQDPITYTYLENDAVQFYTNIWLFNDYDGGTNLTGALYNLSAYTGSLATKYSGTAYYGINSATFHKVNSFSSTYGVVDSLIYVKASNLLFANITPVLGKITHYGSMTMDNVAAGGNSIYDVHDVTIDGQNVYRLQTIDSGSNYRVSSLNALVSSVAVDAELAVLPANGVSTSLITAIVRDQFFKPIVGKLVTFADADTTTGTLVGSNPATTNASGEATITYKSGTKAETVTITATVNQS